MKSKLISAFVMVFVLLLAGCEDHLTRPPLDEMSDDTYWTSESNVESFAWDFYPDFFWGYGVSYSWGKFFSGQTLNDDFAPTNPAQFAQNVPTSGGGWSFSNVRKANLFIDRIQTVPMDNEAIDHWTGVARFFRAMSYAGLVNRFGDVPWYDKVLEEDDIEELYRPRDSRTYVMDRVLADFEFAAENVRENAGADGLTVNRSVVLAFMSRVFLFEGTWLKYHDVDSQKATEYLEASKWAAEQVMNSGRYSVADDYKSLFNSVSLAGNPEIIIYRKYESGVITHSLHTYVNDGEPQTGASRNAVESYLADDGLPISESPRYQGDQDIEDVMANRDPRLTETFVEELRVRGEFSNYSTSGYAVHKFLNENIKDLPEGVSNQNTTDSPVMRYGEVLLNYAEAAAELGTLTQNDLDISINLLRARPGIDMPPLEVQGNMAAVNGTTYDDPERDPDVSGILWEIRRERRVELMMEGFRTDDLRRWQKLEYADTVDEAEKINRGAWIRLSDYPELSNEVEIDGTDEGYIIPARSAEVQRRFNNPRVYLSPIPLDQITLYRDNGAELTQNPGWD